MAYPFGKMPTLAEFVNEAKTQGCVEGAPSGTLRGPRGEVQARYLTRPHSTAPVAVLPNIADDDPLTPVMLGQLVRVLRVSGYDHLIFDP